MRIFITFLSCLLFFGQTHLACALERRDLRFQNPFVSQLPKKPKPIETTEKVTPKTKIRKEIPEEIIPPSLTISGLIWDTKKPQAIVNDEVVSIGDSIDQAEILDISPTGISIRFMGKEFKIDKL